MLTAEASDVFQKERRVGSRFGPLSSFSRERRRPRFVRRSQVAQVGREPALALVVERRQFAARFPLDQTLWTGFVFVRVFRVVRGWK
jgi:hypothetical protein